MNKYIKEMYISILKHGYKAKVERVKDGVYGISLSRVVGSTFYTDQYEDRTFFYLYPRNPYTGEFEYASSY